MKSKILYILLVIPVLVFAQSTNQNYIKTTSYKIPHTSSFGEVDENGNIITTVSPVNESDKIINITYYDGLGRPIQQIANKQSNTGKDIITHIEYDEYSRQSKEYLPYVNSAASLNFSTTAKDDVLSFYASPSLATTGNPAFEATANPFSEKQLENSPLNRVFKQAAPGNAWAMGQGKEIKFDYQTNTATEVKLFKATATWNASLGVYDISVVQNGEYQANQLYKTITKDENWISGNNNTTEEFKDKEGKVVLKRTYNSTPPSGAGGLHDTYYIYDQYGNLTYVIPPLAEGVASEDNLNYLGYQYKYDNRNRLVEKKLPGKQWEFIVYDKLDRPVATGPINNPYGATNLVDVGWMITQYDVFGRVIQTGWKSAIVTAATRSTNQTTINGGTNPFTLGTNDILTQNFYDNYSFAGAPSPLPTPIENQTLATNVKGMPTGSWVKVLDNATSTTAEVSYTLYDSKYRPIHTKTTNYLGGYTQVDTHLDWAGKTLYTLTKHKRTSSSTELLVKDMFEYTDQDRLALHKQQINQLPEQLIAKNTYDELGQLISKNVGGEDATGATSLQTVDYSYNIRGWLNAINDVRDIESENDLFAFKINYNELDSFSENDNSPTPLFNGNIAATYWRTDSDNTMRKYNYSYDNLNRLLEANYSKPDNVSTPDNYLEQLTYDKNGNIQTVFRNGDMDTDGAQSINTIDELVFTYDTTNKNLLKKVIDLAIAPQGFDEGQDDSNGITDPTNDYDYDLNGNMISDTNKGITSILYNHLNLPTKIVFNNSEATKITYLYNAVGQKIKKTVTQGDVVSTEYLSGFQYKNAVLQFFPHAEGYVKYTPASGKGSVAKYNYIFNYTDHLGNVRLSYATDPSDGVLKIIEENHYYPFGLKHSNYNSDQLILEKSEEEILKFVPTNPLLTSTYNYKYNGKEYQDELGLNMYDYGARNYMADIGRWGSIDGKAEKYLSLSPYHYAGNNPVLYLDLDGNEFTESAWKWVNRLIADINSRQASNNKTIEEAKQTIASGKFGWFQSEKSLNNKIARLNNENAGLETTRGETATLAASSQVYDVVENSGNTERDALGNTTTVNQTTFNSDNNRVQLTVSSGTDLGLFSHELKHMYQFETGETTLGLTKNNGGINLIGNNLLFYDLSDEVQAYQRGALFGQRENINSTSDVLTKGIYSDKIPTGPINAVNHPNAAGIKQNPQSFANKYNAAFRIGTTTYKPQ
ncbi:MAG TPA: DUF6443 domain-containing protein [Flavobacterium sp.]|uniref:DUF6443 domain-containing protein n=1 Tax=Flavobacterium sp. TaxID=239 RepID=UPI002B4B02DD|nr:DUF6443 domain-containing protein [Flavobacterium sp.]HLO73032.1 DUF6443 domain-containing protein [Flavobacterium sp.]